MEIKTGDPIVLQTCEYCGSSDMTTIDQCGLYESTIRLLLCNECGASAARGTGPLYKG